MVGVDGIEAANFKVGALIDIAVTTMTLTASGGLVSVSSMGSIGSRIPVPYLVDILPYRHVRQSRDADIGCFSECRDVVCCTLGSHKR